MTFATATIRLSVDANALQSGLQQAANITEQKGNTIKAALQNAASHGSDAFSRLGSSISNALNPLTLAGSALGTSASIAGLGELIASAYKAADQMADLSVKTGVQVEQLSRFSLVAKLSGTDMESVAGILKKLSISAVEAYSGNEKLSRSFDALGITTKELKSISPDDLLIRIAQGIQGIDPMVVQDLMAQLGGKGAMNVLPFLRELNERIDDTGAKISKQFASDAKIFSDNLKLMEIHTQSLGVSIASNLIPQYNILFDTIRNGSGFFSTIGEALKNDLAIMGVDFKKLPEEIIKAQASLETATGLEKASLERRLMVLKKHQAEVNGVLSNEIDQGKTNKAQAAIQANNRSSTSPGDSFIQGLQTRIEKADQGDFAMLRLQAAEKGVLEKADPLISKLKELDISKSVSSYEQSLTLQNQELEFQSTLIGKIGLEKEMLITQHRLELDLAKQIEQIERNKGPLAESTIAQMTAAMQNASAIQTNSISEMLNQQRSFSSGAQRSFAKYADDASNYAGMAEGAFTRAFDNMEMSISEFVKSGKMDFSKLADGIISDLIRVMIRAMIIGPIVKAVMGAATGGIGALFEDGGVFENGNVTPFAKGGIFPGGGIVTKPTIFPMANGMGLMGEAGPEAVMPLRRDSQGRLGVISGQQGAQSVNIIINNNNAKDSEVTAEATQNSQGGMDVLISVIKNTVTDDVRRNGPIGQVMSASFGLRRPVY